MKEKLTSLWQKLFGDSVRAFGVVSLIFLVSLAIAPAKNFFSEWRHYQHGYLRMIRNRSDANTLQRHFQGGIQQIWLPELGVVDRCTSCHVGLKEASLTDVPNQPFRTHPVIPHKLDQFGCTVCHRGQGAATTLSEAHNSTLAWEQPILPAKYIESSCGECHRGPLPGTPQLNQGRSLLSREGCVHCHTVKLPNGSTMKATDDPPSLSHIADKTTREWVFAWLKDPQAYASTSTMPNFKLSEDDARDMSAFLIANSTPQAGDTGTLSAKPSADPVSGASLYGESFCASCHAVQNAAGNMVGGNVGPELTRVGSKVKAEWLQAWLKNPRAYDAGTAMPHYRFNDGQVATLSGFLLSKADSDFLANVHLDAATPEQIAHGKRLVSDYGCASCHEIAGIKKPENFAPELSRVGSKPVTQLIFLAGMPHTLPDYIAGKIKQPREFSPGLKMPQYTLTPAQIDSLTTALLSLNDRSHVLPPSLAVAATPESDYQPAGKAGKLMSDLACFSCHRINGHGGDMAPDLTWEGSSVQREWLVQFFKNPGTLRPSLIRRMPRFNLTDGEVNDLTDYIMTVYQNPAIDRDSMPLSGYSQGQVELGRQLFYGKYSCQGCHIVDSKTDKGYIGPTLTHVGSRLTAAWIYQWMKNPQSLRPGTIEPNRAMSEEDARALTAFLISQKGGGKSPLLAKGARNGAPAQEVAKK
ncbi:MAG TPA: c-type cytochrome [Candidatus Sulfotelmatobacter sp.]|nr:c-type cytochrome [Candidatus Sulfotelmatobacter sp.]